MPFLYYILTMAQKQHREGYKPYYTKFIYTTSDNDFDGYLPSVDNYELMYIPIVFMVYSLLIGIIPWFILQMPVVCHILYPVVYLLYAFDSKVYALIVAVYYMWLIGFCDGYYYRDAMINTNNKKFSYIIIANFQWGKETVYTTKNPYMLPHFYNYVPYYVFQSYQFVKSDKQQEYTKQVTSWLDDKMKTVYNFCNNYYQSFITNLSRINKTN